MESLLDVFNRVKHHDLIHGVLLEGKVVVDEIEEKVRFAGTLAIDIREPFDLVGTATEIEFEGFS